MFHSIRAVIRALIRPNPPTPTDSFLQALGEIRSEHEKITCPRCGAVSYNPNDIANRWCGLCGDMDRPRVKC